MSIDRRGAELPLQADRGKARSVAVIGAGISGLVAAYELQRQGVSVTLYEATSQAGGTIRTSLADGFLAEHGPNSFVTSAPVEALIERLGLEDEVVESNGEANRRFVVRKGRLIPFPMTPLALLATPLLSLRAKLRVLGEPLARAGAGPGDESVASFVRRRLGPEVLDYAVNPFIAGIFAGDPEQLSMAHAFPRVFALEREYGSLSRGLMQSWRAANKARKAGAAAEPDAEEDSSMTADATDAEGRGGATGLLDADHSEAAIMPASMRPRLISFRDGLQTLPDALAESLGNTLKLSTAVRLLHRGENRWIVEAGVEGAARPAAYDAVVLAAPAHALAAMELPAEIRKYALPIERVEYPPVTCLTLGFRREDVTHPLNGFGVLVPSAENRAILGALFSSTLFPDRAPDGHVAITVFIGGGRDPELARAPADELIRRVRTDLHELLGVRGEPVFAKHVYWPRGIPQYTVGYGAIKEAATATEQKNAGLYLTGNYRNGVSIGDCVASGLDVAEKVSSFLAHSG